MTANHQHTPTTEEVRDVWEHHSDWSISDFDRWLAERDARIKAAAEQRGAVKALQDLADNHTVRIPDILGYKVQAVFTETIWEKLDELEGD